MLFHKLLFISGSRTFFEADHKQITVNELKPIFVWFNFPIGRMASHSCSKVIKHLEPAPYVEQNGRLFEKKNDREVHCQH